MVFGKDESRMSMRRFTGSTSTAASASAVIRGTNVAIGCARTTAPIEDEARNIVAFIIADNVDDFILTARSPETVISAAARSVVARCRPITDAHFVNCLDLCGQGYSSPTRPGWWMSNLTCVSTDATCAGLNAASRG